MNKEEYQKMIATNASAIFGGYRSAIITSLDTESERLRLMLACIESAKKIAKLSGIEEPKEEPEQTGTQDIRQTQAKRLYDLGFGKNYKSFEDYLATIPEIPQSLVGEDETYPLLTLDDPRLLRTERCKLAGVKYEEYGYNDETFVPFDARHETPAGPYWFRAHNGRKNRGRKPSDCRQELTGNLLAGTADVLLALFIHHKNVVKQGEHVMDGPGSVSRGVHRSCSYLVVWGGGPRLRDYWHDNANPSYGSVVFRRE